MKRRRKRRNGAGADLAYYQAMGIDPQEAGAMALLGQVGKGKRRRAVKTAGRARRRNGELVTLLAGNPAPKPSAAARAAFKRFHAVDVQKVAAIDLPGEWIALGELREVVYRPLPKEGARSGAEYFHTFGKGARLAASVDGKRLVLIPKKGRPFRVDWNLGIVG